MKKAKKQSHLTQTPLITTTVNWYESPRFTDAQATVRAFLHEEPPIPFHPSDILHEHEPALPASRKSP